MHFFLVLGSSTTVHFNRFRPSRMWPASTPIPLQIPSSVAVQSYGSMGFAAPGTFVLAMVFLTAFVLYYFINWKYLSTVWGLS